MRGAIGSMPVAVLLLAVALAGCASVHPTHTYIYPPYQGRGG